MNDLHKMFEQLNPSDNQKQRVWESINEKKVAPRKSRHIGRALLIAAVISTSVLAFSLGINAASGGKFFKPLEKFFLGDIVETQVTPKSDYVNPTNAVNATDTTNQITESGKKSKKSTKPSKEKSEQATEPKQPTKVLTQLVTKSVESMTEAAELATEAAEPITEPTAPTERVIETLDPNEVICGDYIYLPLSKNTAAVAEYLGNEAKVEIPSEIDGYKIVKIGYGSFICNKTIKEVIIPEGVTEIEEKAFYACRGLLTVNFPETLVTIGKKSFRNTNLHSVVIPDSVEVIASSAFVSQYLSDVKIGTGIKSIASGAFYASFPRTTITISGYTNTVAYDYAREHDIKFISLGYV